VKKSDEEEEKVDEVAAASKQSDNISKDLGRVG
jgi:hypothetical protein